MKSMDFVSVGVATLLVGIAVLTHSVEGQYEDVRCKCICPNVSPSLNSTLPGRKIYIRSFHEPSHCKCENVVDKDIRESQQNFCQRCDCQWQRRNTATIKVVVVIVICVVSLLFFYMLFLLCLDPLLSRRKQMSYVEQRNEAAESERRDSTESEGVFTTVKRKVLKMAGRQEEWKGTVSEQRRNIYDTHSMLN